MKKHLHNSLRALCLSLAVLLSLPMLAVTVEIDGINYDLNAEAKQAAVIAKSSGKYSGEVVIPETVEYQGTTYSVTGIGSSAFYYCSGLTSVTIPNSVTSIGGDAFYNCSGLTSVTIPNSVESIGKNAFYYCSGLTSVTIPNSVVSIGYRAFYNCSGLTLVTIGNGVTSIGDQAFSGCSGLTSVHISDIAAWCKIDFKGYSYNPLYYAHHLYLNGEEVKDLVIPNSVTSIGKYAFYYCSGLTSVTIPNSVESIGDRAFYNCSGLTSVTIPNSVTSIGGYAFYNCSGLTSVTIPNSVTSIGDGAFQRCSGLTSIVVEEGNSVYDSRNNCNAIIETESNTLLRGCMTTIIPDGVESIRWSAFNGCSGLTSVTIPNSVTSIGGSAFNDCSGLTSVTIPNSVTSIGGSAFYNCDGLTSVTIPNSVTSIGEWAFSGCHFVKESFVNNSSLSAEENNYWGAGLHDYETGEGLLIDRASVVYCRRSAEIVTIPNSVTSIGESAFYNCSGLTSVTIPNSVTSIGKNAFYYCSGLTSVTIPNSVESIGDYAFRSCSGLTSVTIPNSVMSIGDYAFEYCSGLTSVTIGNGVKSIGDKAFSGCMLQTIVCKAIKPVGINADAFSANMFNHTQLYVPEGAYWDYAFSGWGSFIRIKEMAMDTEDLESRKVYMIADASGRNYSVYDSAKGDLVNITYTHALDEESEGSCWTVLKEGNASYLYNIGAKKYGAVSESGVLTLSDTPMVIDIVNTEDGLSINGKPCMFVLNNNISFDATGIEEMKGENGKVKTAVYDLSGRRVQKAQKGIYVQNGKVVVK